MTLAPIRGAPAGLTSNDFTPMAIGFFDGAIMGGAARNDQEAGRQSRHTSLPGSDPIAGALR